MEYDGPFNDGAMNLLLQTNCQHGSDPVLPPTYAIQLSAVGGTLTIETDTGTTTTCPAGTGHRWLFINDSANVTEIGLKICSPTPGSHIAPCTSCVPDAC